MVPTTMRRAIVTLTLAAIPFAGGLAAHSFAINPTPALGAVAAQAASDLRPEATIILVRHTEKDRTKAVSDTDVPLTEAGEKQAKRLALALRDADIDRMLASDFLRTQQTIGPVVKLYNERRAIKDEPSRETAEAGATLKQLPLHRPKCDFAINKPGDFQHGTASKALAETLLDEAKTHRVVFASAHSTQIPGVLSALGGWTVALDDNDYEFMFIVTIRSDGTASLIRAAIPQNAK